MTNPEVAAALAGKKKLLRDWASRLHHEQGMRVILAYVEVLINVRLRLRAILWDSDGVSCSAEEVLQLLEEVNQRIARELPQGILTEEESHDATT